MAKEYKSVIKVDTANATKNLDKLKTAMSNVAKEDTKTKKKLIENEKKLDKTTKEEMNTIRKKILLAKEADRVEDRARRAVDRSIKANNRKIKATKKLIVAQEKAQAKARSLAKAQTLQGKASGFAGKAMSMLPSGLKAFLNPATAVVAVIGAIGMGLKNMVMIGARFEKQMDKVGATTKASAKDMQLLTQSALDLGRNSTKTTIEVGQLQLELAKLGYTTNDILNAQKAVIQLAEAADIDLAQAAKVAASTVKQFGLQASDTAMVVDIMANSFSSSALDIDKFQTAMGYVGVVADTANISLERSSAMLAILSDRGMEASTSGTSLRSILLKLATSGMSYNDAMKQINESTNKSATATELFGVKASTAAIILASSTKEVDKLTESFENSDGSAKEMSDRINDNLIGDLAKLSSAWEGLSISIGKGDGALGEFSRKSIQTLTDLLDFMTPDDSPTEDTRTDAEKAKDRIKDLESTIKLEQEGINEARKDGDEKAAKAMLKRMKQHLYERQEYIEEWEASTGEIYKKAEDKATDAAETIVDEVTNIFANSDEEYMFWFNSYIDKSIEESYKKLDKLDKLLNEKQNWSDDFTLGEEDEELDDVETPEERKARKKKEEDEKVENNKKTADSILNTQKSLFSSLDSLYESDMDSQEDRKNMTDAELKESDKKNKDIFEKQKKLKYIQATIDTLTAMNGAYSAMASIPVVGPALGIAAAGAAGFAGFANVKKIEASRYGGATSNSNVNAGKVGSINPNLLPQAVQSPTQNVNNINKQPDKIDNRVYVLEQDIRDTGNRVSTAEQESSF